MSLINPEVVIVAAGFSPYTGNASFAARNAAWERDGQRLFVQPSGWADVRYATVASLTDAGLSPDTDFRPGGSAASKLQIRWSPDVVRLFAANHAAPALTGRKLIAARPVPTREQVEEYLAAASK